MRDGGAKRACGGLALEAPRRARAEPPPGPGEFRLGRSGRLPISAYPFQLAHFRATEQGRNLRYALRMCLSFLRRCDAPCYALHLLHRT